MRIYDPRVGRFLSMDPISKSYPMLTPYQFASNTPIQAIDLDGGEAKYVYGYFDEKKERTNLKKTEWLVVNGLTDKASFAAAAQHNTSVGNFSAYTKIRERYNWYEWAAEKTSAKGNYWFAAAADVTSYTMVGAADEMNMFFMNDEHEKILRGANEFLLAENFKNFGKYVLGEGAVSWKGKLYDNLSGSALDNQMVVIEMTTLQGYLDQYKKDYVSKNGQDKWNDLSKGLNNLFNNIFLGTFSPESNKFSQEEFSKKYGKDTKFDFMNLEHRIFQGQKMAEYLRKQNKKDKQTSSAKNE